MAIQTQATIEDLYRIEGKAELVNGQIVRDSQNPTIYSRNEIAGAEPAVPNWTMPVNDLFP